MRSPADHIGSKYVPGDRDDGRVGQDVVDGWVEEMRGADGVAVSAGRQDAIEELVEVGADRGDLLLSVDPEILEKPISIEALKLLRG